MNSLLNKLQFKDHKNFLILNSPKEFESTKPELYNLTNVHEKLDSNFKYDFVIVFVKTCAEIESETSNIFSQLNDDTVLWFAYPKKSSKKYSSDISRDDGWQPLGDAGFEGVRQVAIDDDWSALRFRKVEHIKSFKRDKSRAMSETGVKRTQ